MSMNLIKAFNSFDGFRGAELPSYPTNQKEFSALVNAVDGGSCWEETAPTWKEVEDKMAEYDAEDTQKADNKASGKQKLKDLGLTDDEISALIG